MFTQDIILALHLLSKMLNDDNICIECITNHFVYLTSGKRIAFRDIEKFMKNYEAGYILKVSVKPITRNEEL